jgi:hypothetical protein
MEKAMNKPLAKVVLSIGSMLSSAAIAQSTHDAPLFSLTKSENKNEVVYAIHLDAHCAPMGEAPVYAFWRMNERGGIIEPLLSREEPAYGIGAERVLARDADGGVVDVTLRALPSRHIVVRTRRRDATCETSTTLAISGAQASLTNIDVKLKPFGVDYVVVSGRTTSGVVREKIQP